MGTFFFNFNSALIFNNLSVASFRNIYKKDISLFIVFKSKSDDEKTVLYLRSGNQKTFLTNKNIYGNGEFLYKKVISEKGIIVSYLSSGNEVNRRNSLHIEKNIFNGHTETEQIMELICFDRILNEVERLKVETYLAIKNGISFVGEKHYLSSQKDTIWNIKKNKIFNNRITGIGRDDVFGLYQKQSGNSEKDGVYIGLGEIDSSNVKNKNTLQDRSFLLWGDNGQSTTFVSDKKNKNHKLMKRLWKTQPFNANINNDSVRLKFRVNKQENGFVDEKDKNNFLWLAVITDPHNNGISFTNASFFRQTEENDHNIDFDSIPCSFKEECAFTFIKAPDFFFEYEPQTLGCGETAVRGLKIKVIGGTPPYKLNLIMDKNEQSVTLDNDYYEFKNLDPGDYTITVTESRQQSQQEEFSFNDTLGLDVSVEPKWQLNDKGTVIVHPNSNNQRALKYEWLLGSEIKGAGDFFEATTTGEYSLKVYSENCFKEIPFSILDKATAPSTRWAIYPNPAKRLESFSVVFNLDEESDVDLSIYSIEGKLLSSDHIGLIKSYTHTAAISTSGIYVVKIQINDTVESTRIIIK
jgi:hypothetical protein